MPHDVAAVEARYHHARDRADRAAIAEARGEESVGSRADADAARADLAEALAAHDLAATTDPAGGSLGEDDRRALNAIRDWLATDAGPGVGDDGFATVSGRIEREYAAAASAVRIGSETITRLGVLERLSREGDRARRRDLFAALEPVWRAIDGDRTGSAYRDELLHLSVGRWRAGRSPVDANARALGIDPDGVESTLTAILATWRDAYAGTPIEPWDWWYAAGAADRALAASIPLDRLRPISDAYHASLGADPVALDIGFDVFPRPGRPEVPVAYTDFGGRPSLAPPRRAKAWVMGTYTAGGLGELTELVHETGHAIHIAAIETRPAFADWPDSDAFTEAIAELTALDTAEPAWQQRWLGRSVPTDVSLRGRYAGVMLDICWAVWEIRMHTDPDARPNDVWTDLTSTYLGIVPHAEMPWWAMRGQLFQEPGYMVNYALGPILAADMRARIRSVRGDWTSGDPGWYAWVSANVYRFGVERSSGRVLADLLGRAPNPDALVHEIGRGAA